MARVSIKVIAKGNGVASIGTVNVDESRHSSDTRNRTSKSHNTRGDTSTSVDVSASKAKSKTGTAAASNTRRGEQA